MPLFQKSKFKTKFLMFLLEKFNIKKWADIKLRIHQPFFITYFHKTTFIVFILSSLKIIFSEL